MVVNGMKTLLK
ncbi:hypothetical protein HaLaN_29871, partial [Haematococcus lacustris]